MRDGVGRDGGISFDGARAFVVGFAAFCAGCVAIDYGTDRIAASFESADSAVQSASTLAGSQPPEGAGSAPASLPGAGVAAAPNAPVHLPQTAPLASVKAPAAAPSPCAKPAGTHAAGAVARTAPAAPSHLPLPGALQPPRLAASPLPAKPAPLAAKPVPPPISRAAVSPGAKPLTAASAAGHMHAPAAPNVNRPVPVIVRSAPAAALPPPARSARWRRRAPALSSLEPAAPAAHASGGLLVPFRAAAALTPKSALDQHAAGQAPLLISPGAAATPPPEAGTLRNR